MNQANENILSADNLKKYFYGKNSIFQNDRSAIKAVDGVSLSIGAGKTLGLVGESGSGKSTLGRLLLRLESLDGGKVIFDGRDVYSLPKRKLWRLRSKMQLIFQDPYGSLDPRMSVKRIIGEGVLRHRLVEKSELTKYVVKVMDACGLPAYMLDRYPNEFSGGQRQRVCIARAVALRPKFIIADEAVSALDVSMQAQIVNLLRDLQYENNYSYLFISHDLSIVEYISDVVAVMYLGNIVETAPRRELFSDPLHPYTKTLLNAVLSANHDRRRSRVVLNEEIPSPARQPSGCAFHPRCAFCMNICKTIKPRNRALQGGREVMCHLYGDNVRA